MNVQGEKPEKMLGHGSSVISNNLYIYGGEYSNGRVHVMIKYIILIRARIHRHR